MDFERELISIVRQTPWLMECLVTARRLNLDQWCIGAGAVRNTVWDWLHGYQARPSLDIDLVYFDQANPYNELEKKLERKLTALLPGFRWDVVNQAAVHVWYESTFGAPLMPYRSLEDAVSSWPETATAIGITITSEGEIEVIAPLGLADLFGMKLRMNARCVDKSSFARRLVEKAYCKRWPNLSVVA